MGKRLAKETAIAVALAPVALVVAPVWLMLLTLAWAAGVLLYLVWPKGGRWFLARYVYGYEVNWFRG